MAKALGKAVERHDLEIIRFSGSHEPPAMRVAFVFRSSPEDEHVLVISRIAGHMPRHLDGADGRQKGRLVLVREKPRLINLLQRARKIAVILVRVALEKARSRLFQLDKNGVPLIRALREVEEIGFVVGAERELAKNNAKSDTVVLYELPRDETCVLLEVSLVRLLLAFFVEATARIALLLHLNSSWLQRLGASFNLLFRRTRLEQGF